MKKYFTLLSLFLLNFYFSQQTEGFKNINTTYEAERKEIDAQHTLETSKNLSEKKLSEVSSKYIGQLSDLQRRKNIENLEEVQRTKIFEANNPIDESRLPVYDELEEVTAQHPKGYEFFRNEIMNNLYSENINGNGNLRCNIIFTVEKDGSLRNVKATGENENFNKQAELALYLTKYKWNPARKNGKPQKSRMNLPLILNFE